jgi:hypothetical protein
MIDGTVLTSARWHDRFGARSATAIAKTDGALVPISKKDFVALVSRATTRNGRILATSAKKRFM